MRRLLTIILVSIIANTLNAQTVGDLYKQYKAAVEAGDMKTAFIAIKECYDQTDHCPFASAALAVMYDQGYGTKADSVEALMSFLDCEHYEYFMSRHNQSNGTIANALNSLGCNINVDVLNDMQRKKLENYEQYMKLDMVNQTCVKAFAYRMNAIRCMKYYDDSKSSGDTEEMLANLESALEDCLAADSLNSDAYANYLMGKIFYEGLLGFKDKETGLVLLDHAAEDDCISAKVYLAKLDIKKGNIEAAKEKLDDVIYKEVLPITPLLMDKCYMLIDPNYDHYDVLQCKQEAIELMKSLDGEVE